MSLYGRLFAAVYDRMLEGAEKAGLADFRKELLSEAKGRVLEIGAGTGANLPYYGPEVSELVLLEPEEPMARRLEWKLRQNGINAQVVRGPAEKIPLPSARFDCIVSTLVLCTVSDPNQVLAELRRLLKPDGRLLLIEHVRSEDPRLARWQDRLHRPWSWLGHGCQCNRPTRDLLRTAHFAVDRLRSERLPKAPPIVRPLLVGEATQDMALD